VGPLRSVAISPDGCLAAAGSGDGRIVVWDVERDG
jgi:WD40 repeat protein